MTWNHFERGLHVYLGSGALTLAQFDELAAGIVTNYNTAEGVNGKEYRSVLGSAEGLRDSILEVLARSSLLVFLPHTSLGSTLPVQRALIEELGHDFRHNMYEIQGPFPQVFNIGSTVSPFALSAALGSILRTVGVTPSNQIPDEEYTDQEKRKLIDWQKARRAEFKSMVNHVLSVPGNVVFVHPSGRRAALIDGDSKYLDYRPSDKLSYATREIAILPVGVVDTLPSIGPVYIKYGSIIRGNFNKRQLLGVWRTSCNLSESPDGVVVTPEGRFAQTRRLLSTGVIPIIVRS